MDLVQDFPSSKVIETMFIMIMYYDYTSVNSQNGNTQGFKKINVS